MTRLVNEADIVNKTRPLFTLSLEMTRLVNWTRLLLVPGVNSDIYSMYILLQLISAAFEHPMLRVQEIVLVTHKNRSILSRVLDKNFVWGYNIIGRCEPKTTIHQLLHHLILNISFIEIYVGAIASLSPPPSLPPPPPPPPPPPTPPHPQPCLNPCTAKVQIIMPGPIEPPQGPIEACAQENTIHLWSQNSITIKFRV